MKKTSFLLLLFFVSIILFLITVEAQAVIVSNATELSNAIGEANNGGDPIIELRDGTLHLG